MICARFVEILQGTFRNTRYSIDSKVDFKRFSQNSCWENILKNIKYFGFSYFLTDFCYFILFLSSLFLSSFFLFSFFFLFPFSSSFFFHFSLSLFFFSPFPFLFFVSGGGVGQITRRCNTFLFTNKISRLNFIFLLPFLMF